MFVSQALPCLSSLHFHLNYYKQNDSIRRYDLRMRERRRSFMSRIRVVAILEGRVVTGPAKNLLKFAAACQDKIDLTLVTFQRSAGNGANPSPNQLISEALSLNIPVEVIRETSPVDFTTVSALHRIL